MLFIFKLGEAKRASRSRWSTENSQDYLAKKPEEAGPKRQEGEGGGEGKGAGVEGYLPTPAVSFNRRVGGTRAEPDGNLDLSLQKNEDAAAHPTPTPPPPPPPRTLKRTEFKCSLSDGS